MVELSQHIGNRGLGGPLISSESLCSEDLGPASFMAGLLQGKLQAEQEVKASTMALEVGAETVLSSTDRHNPHFTLPLHFDGSPAHSL